MATTLANPQDVNSGLTTDATNSSSSSNLPSAGSQQGMVQSSAPANAGLSGVLTQAAVRQAMPGIIVFLTIAVFLLAYLFEDDLVEEPLTEEQEGNFIGSIK